MKLVGVVIRNVSSNIVFVTIVAGVSVRRISPLAKIISIVSQVRIFQNMFPGNNNNHYNLLLIIHHAIELLEFDLIFV